MKKRKALLVLVWYLTVSLLALLLAACAPRAAFTSPSSTPSPATATSQPPEPSLTPTLQPPAASSTATETPSQANPSYQARISGGALHTCLVTGPGGVLCWGANDFGQLGSDAELDIKTFGKPHEVIGFPGTAKAIAAGAYHTCALTQTGGVLCWGQNQFGQLGDGTLTDTNRPVEVSGLSVGIAQISAGYAHTCAVTIKGELKCWGQNQSGLLGDGTTTDRSTPVEVQGLPGRVVQVAIGWVYTCALSEAGQVWCWGDGTNDRFGDGSMAVYTTPVKVGGQIKDVIRVAAGQNHLCALIVSGEVLCWGSLTSEGPYSPEKPMSIEGLSGTVLDLVAGGGHTCALNDQGAVQCWGDNYFGQLGDGTDLASWTPITPLGLSSGVSAIGSGGGHVCALLDNGNVQCWGDGSAGQVGDGTITWK